IRITSSVGADHESRRGAVGASGASNRKDSTPRCDQEIVALRDFNSPMTALGHFRHINTLLALAACPLPSHPAQICARRHLTLSTKTRKSRQVDKGNVTSARATNQYGFCPHTVTRWPWNLPVPAIQNRGIGGEADPLFARLPTPADRRHCHHLTRRPGVHSART